MLFLIIERFKDHTGEAAYWRFAERGRMIPEGVRYIDSWVELAGARCFQLMECDEVVQLQPWIDAWADLVDFEVSFVTDIATAAQRFRG